MLEADFVGELPTARTSDRLFVQKWPVPKNTSKVAQGCLFSNDLRPCMVAVFSTSLSKVKK